MRLALLIGAAPRSSQQGPTVRVPPGWWRFHVEGLVDSRLHVEPHQQEIVHGETLTLAITHDLCVQFIERGSEDYINIFLDRVA